MTDAPSPVLRRDLARSAALFRAFLREADAPIATYRLLADDTVALIARHLDLPRTVAVDVGGGPGYTAQALRRAGAHAFTVDAGPAELVLHGASPEGALVADGTRLPFADRSLDLSCSCNTLEHVAEPWVLLDELIRVVRPGGLVFLSFTNWLSPWGGHETSPWHYLGGHRAARRHLRRTGQVPKNRYGASLFRVGVGEALARVRAHPGVRVLDAYPRYLPAWCRPVVSVPGVREIATWNLALALERGA